MLQDMRKRAEGGDRASVFTLYEAPAECALDDVAAWRAANPGLGTIKAERYMQDSSRAALVTPADQLHFRAFDLNQRVAQDRHAIVTMADWAECEREGAELPERSGPCVVGLDLGGSASMTAGARVLAGVWTAGDSGRVPGDP